MQLLVPHGAWLPWTRAIREVVSIPVIASNRINTLDQADTALAAGDADLISLARPFLADPALIRRARDGRAVNVCIGCDQACIDRSIFDQRVSCIVNPRAGHELEQADADLRGRSVAVVGGGPAGMEAARSLAEHGAAVTLFDAGRASAASFGWRAGYLASTTTSERSSTSRRSWPHVQPGDPQPCYGQPGYPPPPQR